jgi:hypothetical protein
MQVGDVAQWQSVPLAYVRLWVQHPALETKHKPRQQNLQNRDVNILSSRSEA